MSDSALPANANILLKIRALLPSLNEQEQKVGQYVLAHPEEVVHLSMSDVAERSATGDATVFRFCRRISGDGYQEFKIRLARELGAAQPATYEEIGSTDDLTETAHKIVSGSIKALQDTLLVLDPVRFHGAIDLFLHARRVAIYGSGGAGVAARELEYRLLRVGVPGVAYTDSKLQRISASLLSSADVALGISHSGESQDVLRAMEMARQAGANLIAITNHPASALSQMADITLLTAAQEGLGHSDPLGTRVAQIALIEILYTYLAQRQGDKTERALQRVAKAVYHH